MTKPWREYFVRRLAGLTQRPSAVSLIDSQRTRITLTLNSSKQVCNNHFPFVQFLAHPTRLFPVQDFLVCFVNVLAVILFVCIATPLIIPLLVGMIVLYFFVQRYFIATSRELQRIQSIATSPVYSHFSEMLNGTATIRAYDMEKRFATLVLDKMETVTSVALTQAATNRWLSCTIGIIGAVIALATTLAGIISRQWGIMDAGTRFMC